MKKLTLSIVLIASICLQLAAQDFTVKINEKDYPLKRDGKVDAVFSEKILSLAIKRTKEKPAKKYYISVDTLKVEFDSTGDFTTVNFASDIRDIPVQIVDKDDNEINPFVLNSKSVETPVTHSGVKLPTLTATEYLLTVLFKNKIVFNKERGLTLKSTPNSEYTGTEYIHLFFDQFGNTLLRTVPTGIARAQYVVHVIYLAPKDDKLSLAYDVNQTAGEKDDDFVIRGANSVAGDELKLESKDDSQQEFVYRHFEKLLEGSNSDIKFDIVRNVINVTDNTFEPTKTTIASYTIKIKKSYVGSVDVGILFSKLEKPSFSLVSGPASGTTDKVVKKDEAGRRVVTSVMYSFYFSPILLLEKLANPDKKKNVSAFSRNFVDDHAFYERIYPTFGLGLSDKVFENFYAGGKWEFAPGGSIFVGYHYGKINSYDAPENFVYGQTVTTDGDFAIRNGKSWKGGLCFGLNMDVRILLSLFKTSPGGTQP